MITTINEFKEFLNENIDNDLLLPKNKEEFIKILDMHIHNMISSFSDGYETSIELKNIYEMILSKPLDITPNEDNDILLSIVEMDNMWYEIKESYHTLSEDTMNKVIELCKYSFDDILTNYYEYFDN